jgi:hypothetical protein
MFLNALLCSPHAIKLPYYLAQVSMVVAKLTGEQRPWMKLVVEDGVDWTKQEALSSVRETHGVEGFLKECYSLV